MVFGVSSKGVSNEPDRDRLHRVGGPECVRRVRACVTAVVPRLDQLHRIGIYTGTTGEGHALAWFWWN